jgi:DNA mismatch repair protein MutS2
MKHKHVDEKLEELRLKELSLKEQREKIAQELEEQKFALKRSYDVAISEAKNAAKAGDVSAIHRAMNKANQQLPKEEIQSPKEPERFTVGQSVKYHSQRGIIISMKGEKEAIIEVDGMRVRARAAQLKPIESLRTKAKVDIKLSVEKKAGLKCDLHGMRADEACDTLDSFISNALINGWDEVIIYHGIGTGKLSFAVKNFLKAHPSVKKFEDAPQHMGGFGAKIVTL